MLVFAMAANTLLGAGLALKEVTLYAAYGHIGRLWDFAPLADETLGGLIVWIPGSVASVPVFFVLLRMWGACEIQLATRRSRGLVVRLGAIAQTANHRVAWLLAFAALVAFAGTIGVGVVAVR